MGFPRASWLSLLGSTPLITLGLKSSATAVVPAETANLAHLTAGAGLPGMGLMVFDGANFSRAQSVTSGSFPATGASGLLAVGLFASDTAVQQPLITRQGNDAELNTFRGLFTTSRGSLYNGTSWDRARNGSAANLGAVTQPFGLQVAMPGEWTVDSSVAAAGTPSASKGAGAAGVRHVCRNLSISLANIGVVPSPLITIVLRDGATGAGTVKRTWQFVIPVSSTINIDPAGLNILGTAATAMTLEATAALPANVSGVCSLAGYSTI